MMLVQKYSYQYLSYLDLRFFFSDCMNLLHALSCAKYRPNLISASIDAIEPATDHEPVAIYDTINVIVMDSIR